MINKNVIVDSASIIRTPITLYYSHTIGEITKHPNNEFEMFNYNSNSLFSPHYNLDIRYD